LSGRLFRATVAHFDNAAGFIAAQIRIAGKR